MSNSLPLIIGPIVVKAHLSLTWLWYLIAILNTVNSHSGYHMPFMLSSEGHDFHHLKYVTMFGNLTLGWTLNTYQQLFIAAKVFV